MVLHVFPLRKAGRDILEQEILVHLSDSLLWVPVKSMVLVFVLLLIAGFDFDKMLLCIWILNIRDLTNLKLAEWFKDVRMRIQLSQNVQRILEGSILSDYLPNHILEQWTNSCSLTLLCFVHHR